MYICTILKYTGRKRESTLTANWALVYVVKRRREGGGRGRTSRKKERKKERKEGRKKERTKERSISRLIPFGF